MAYSGDKSVILDQKLETNETFGWQSTILRGPLGEEWAEKGVLSLT